MKIAVALVLIALAPAAGRAQNPLVDGLRKGIVEEDVNHNLDAAIKDYRSVVAGYEATRQIVATALFRMAECYRRQGKTQEAMAAYTRVVNEFAEQTQVVAASQRQLGNATPESGPANEVEARRRYRDSLEQKVELAQQKLAEVSRRVELGTASASENAEAQIGVIRAQRQLASFDAGLTGPQASGASTQPAALRARAQVRKLIAQETGVVMEAMLAEEKRLQLGIANVEAVNRLKLALIELNSELASLDAGPQK